jgi:hypothetical protein
MAENPMKCLVNDAMHQYGENALGRRLGVLNQELRQPYVVEASAAQRQS